MRAYMQTDKKGDFYNVNSYIAYRGFEELGWELGRFYDVEEISNRDAEHIIVGGVGNVRKRLLQLGMEWGEELEYPFSLEAYLGREVWRSTLETVIHSAGERNIFIKPVQTKLFKGKVIRTFSDFIGLNRAEDIPIWCSEVIDFRTEWRCFVRYGELWDVRYYRGDWGQRLDVERVKEAIEDFEEEAPAAYCLDFGVDENGECWLVEVNDGYSLGSYGMEPIKYVKFLSARWAELTGTKDYLDF